MASFRKRSLYPRFRNFEDYDILQDSIKLKGYGGYHESPTEMCNMEGIFTICLIKGLNVKICSIVTRVSLGPKILSAYNKDSNDQFGPFGLKRIL